MKCQLSYTYFMNQDKQIEGVMADVFHVHEN